jgi:hypothetical protein
MRSAAAWFFLLAGLCIFGPYLLGVPPKTRRDRVYLAITIAFLVWILPLMISLRSREVQIVDLEVGPHRPALTHASGVCARIDAYRPGRPIRRRSRP